MIGGGTAGIAWLAFCFGSVIIGVLLLFFAPAILLLPFEVAIYGIALIKNGANNMLGFTFFSPSDLDAYFRPKISYKVTDAWQVEGGANFFVGKNDYSFFGQFALNNNVYGSVRYSF
ncbi:MAG: hypothetical protein PSN04_05480 [Methyloprofundus sp.]|nr:hypothetical protein [Methyloprofundus sp.]